MNPSSHVHMAGDLFNPVMTGFLDGIGNTSKNIENGSRASHMYADYALGPLNQSLVGITSSLSMLGSLVIILSYISWKDIRTTSRTILLFLSLSDLLIAVGDLFGTVSPLDPANPRDPVCVAQSFVTNTASIMSFCWTATLALYLYLTIVKNKQSLARNLLPWLHVLNWSIGPVINIIAVNQGMLGSSSNELTGGWCWIYHSGKAKDRTKEVLWLLFDAKLIEFLVYGSILLLYILIKVKLHKELKLRANQSMKKDMLRAARSADRKLIFIPILLILGRFWGTLRFLMFCAGALPPETSGSVLPSGQKMLLTLQGIGDSCQGLLNCILFCFMNPKVYDHLKEFVCVRVCRLKKPGSNHENEREASIMENNSLNAEDDSSMFSQGDLSRPLLQDKVRNYSE